MTDLVATLKAKVELLEAELAAEQQRSAGHRADYERERDRADRMVTAQDRLVTELEACVVSWPQPGGCLAGHPPEARSLNTGRITVWSPASARVNGGATA